MLFGDISFKLGSNNINVLDYLNNNIDKNILEKIANKSGIFSLNVAQENENSVSLVKSLLTDKVKNNLSKCQLIIVITESKTQRIPPLSSLIFEDVDTSDSLILDLDSGCAGYLQALQVVESFFTNKRFKKASIVTVDTYTKFISMSNRSVSPIFGDGSSINFFHNNDKNSIISSDFGTFGSDYRALVCSAKLNDLNMNGAEIFVFIKSKVIPSIKKTIENSKINISEIDYFIVHQASLLVIDEIKNYFNIPDNKIFFEIQNTGNLVSTSIPYLLSKQKGTLKNNSRILFSAFGVGLTYSNLLVDYENNNN